MGDTSDITTELIGNVHRHKLTESLSTPLKNILDRWAEGKPFSVKQLRELVESRVIHPKTTRNLGKKRYGELCNWLMIKIPVGDCCPQCGYDLTKLKPKKL